MVNAIHGLISSGLTRTCVRAHSERKVTKQTAVKMTVFCMCLCVCLPKDCMHELLSLLPLTTERRLVRVVNCFCDWFLTRT